MLILPGQIHLVYHYASGKDRPVLVVSRAELNRGSLVLATPFSTQKIESRRLYPNWVVIDAGTSVLDKTSACAGDNLFQVALIDMVQYLGDLTTEQMDQVKAAMSYSLNL